jgi:uncharacterized protein (TIGR03083 family)
VDDAQQADGGRIAQLEEVWRSTIQLGRTIADDEWDRPTDLPGWSVRDCYSHLVGTERSLMGDPMPEVAVDHLPHLTGPMAAMIELPVEARRTTPGAEVLAEWEDVSARRLAELRAMPDEQWDVVGWSPVGEVPFRTFMEVRVFDSWMHEQDVRRALGRPGHLHGPCVAVSVGRIRNALGFVVGKRAGAPDGASVVFEVTGDDGGTFPVVVAGGRARLADEVPADPTVHLTLDVETFCALGGGRWSGERARAEGRVAVTGDEALADAVLGAMAITP